jgi:CheY-like chemotaxis protein/HPt (histidine-containing phosphotransfer) domain-containing protein
LLATVAHEARLPLNAVIGMTELLRQMSLPADAAVLVETIHTSGEQLLALVNDLLDSTCLDAGRLVLEHVDFALRDVVEQAVGIAAATSAAGSLSVEALIDPSLPEVVRGDPRRFGQVLVNLLGNAVRFTASGFVCLRLTPLSRASHTITCRVEVQDSGIGIEREALPRLFEPFVQADAATGRCYGGTGLGLSIAAGIVAAMGSRIHVDSVPGTGSRFHFDVEFACVQRTPTPALPACDGLRVVLATRDTLLTEVVRAQAARLAVPFAVIDSPQAVSRLAGTAPVGLLLDSRLDTAEAVHAAAVGARLPVLELVPSRQAGPAHARVHVRRPVRLRALAQALTTLYSGDTRTAEQGAAGWDSRPCLTTSPLDRRRVLIVEDDDASRQLVSRVLASAGVRVDVVTSGEAACTAVASRTYDLVLMDGHLPGMDGFAATRVIRAAGAGLPIIGVTASAASDVRTSCLEAGMSDVLVKPTRPSALLDMLRRWLPETSTGAPDLPGRPRTDPRVGALLEPAVVADLTRLDLFVDMARAVTRDAPSRLVDLGEAATLGDLGRLARAAHRLTTVLGNVGWTSASAVASQLEQACGEADADEARRHAQALEHEVLGRLPELQRLVERAAGVTSTCAH